MELQDAPQRHRFELIVDGETAGQAIYRMRDNAVIVTHSEVDPRFRGRGLANELARRTLDLIRSRGQSVVPLCPFFAHFVDTHAEYADLVEDY